MTVRRAIAGLLAAAAIASCSHAPPVATVRAERRWDASCRVKRGCPKAAAPARCPSEMTPVALGELVRRAGELDGETIAVRGPLQRTGGTCTLLACYSAKSVQTQPSGLAYRYRAPERGKPAAMATLDDETFGGDRVLLAEQGCCNRCGEALALGGALWLAGPQLACGGDESLICCSVDAHGQDVVARGVLRRHSSVLELEGAVVCSP